MSVSSAESQVSPIPATTSAEKPVSDKLARKRILDRKAQKAARDRTKWNIENLEHQVAQLNNALITETTRLQALLQASAVENERVRAENQSLKAQMESSRFSGSSSFLENMGFMPSDDIWDSPNKIGESQMQMPRSMSLAGRRPSRPINIPISSLLGDSSTKSSLFEAVPWSTGPTCVSDRILQSYVATARMRVDDTSDLFLREQPDINALIMPKRSTESPGVSTVVSDILLAYQEINTLPKKVACLYVMYKFLNWLIFRTKSTYDQMPPWLRPVPLQLQLEHPAWIDRIPWPNARLYLINNPSITFDDFVSIYSSSFHVSWPYDHSHVFITAPAPAHRSSSQSASPPGTTMAPETVLANWFLPNGPEEPGGEAGGAVLNPVFEQHLRQLRNWSVGAGFKRKFPELSAIIESDSRQDIWG